MALRSTLRVALLALVCCRPVAEERADRGETKAPAGNVARTHRAIETRRDVPAAAADTIRRARTAIAANDLDALARLLDDEVGDFDDLIPDGEVKSKTRGDAIRAWTAKPGTLARIDEALAADCIFEGDDVETTLVCGRERRGATFVILESDDGRFEIDGYGTARD
jgi:hypothetical protein